MMRKFLILLVCLAAASVASASTATSSAWTGNWRLDAQNSILAVGNVTDLTLRVDRADEGALNFTFHGRLPDGSTFAEEFRGRADGRDYPVTVADNEIARASWRWITGRLAKGTARETHGAVETLTLELTPDGKTLIQHRKVRARKGEYEDRLVFRKEADDAPKG